MAQRSQHTDRVLDLAREEADRFGHRYLGSEHLVLGMLRDGDSAASRTLEARGLDLPAAREALGRLVDHGVVPGPRPSDTELLGTLGIDLDVIRQSTERTFGRTAVGWGDPGGDPGATRWGWAGTAHAAARPADAHQPGAGARWRAGPGARPCCDWPRVVVAGGWCRTSGRPGPGV